MSRAAKDKACMFKLAQLQQAFKLKRDVKFIKKILIGMEDINYKLDDNSKYKGNTALHLAQMQGERLEVYQLLIEHGADFTLKNDEERTALRKAVKKKKYVECYRAIDESFEKAVDAVLSAHVQKSVPDNPADKDGLTHFHIACMADHPESVEMFLDNGVPIDLAVNESSPLFPGCSPLHIATRCCAVDVVKVLLKRGADLRARDKHGMTAMHWLIDCSRKMVDSMQYVEDSEPSDTWFEKLNINRQMVNLLYEKYDVYTDEIGMSALHVACTLRSTPRVEDVLAGVLDIDQRVDVTSRVCPGYTALHFAAYFDLNAMRLLLAKGANIEIQSVDGFTPLDICLQRYPIKAIHAVMSTQANWREIRFAGRKSTLLDFVYAMRDIGSFKSFLDRHFRDINTPVSENSPLWPGYTPLHLAVLFAEQDKNTSNYESTVLCVWEFMPRLKMVMECLRRGADVTAEDASGCTPLHLAFRHRKTCAMKKLLQHHRSPLNPTDENHVSHFHIACAMGRQDLVKRMLESGVLDLDLPVLSHFTVYERDRDNRNPVLVRIAAGSTPLHITTAARHSEIVRLLVNSGADVNAVDVNGASPIHRLLAEVQFEDESNQLDISRSLLSGALKNVVVSEAGISHLHVASYFGNVVAAERLLNRGANIDAPLGSQSALRAFCDHYSDRRRWHCTICYSYYANATALHVALSQGSTQVANFLIDRGADILTKNADEDFPLRYIIAVTQRRTCMWLLTENDIIAKRVERDHGLTAIHLACYRPNPVVIAKLIDDGANVNAQIHENAFNLAGFTPLHMVIVYSFEPDKRKLEADSVLSDLDLRRNILDTTRLLLAAGADATLCCATGVTPLHTCAEKLFTDSLATQLLMLMFDHIKNFSVNPVDDIIGMSHFHIACYLNDTVAVEKFLEHGVMINAAVDLFSGHAFASYLQLHLVAQPVFGHGIPPKVEVIDILLKNGADVNAQNVGGNTVAHLIARYASDRLDIFQRLISAGADLNKPNDLCETPFTTLLLSSRATPEVIDCFLKHGCGVNDSNDADQPTCLSRPLCKFDLGSTRARRTLIYEALFKSRDLTVSDAAGRTAIHNIVSVAGVDVSENVPAEEYSSLIARLCKEGCDIDSQDMSGRTALHLAACFKNNKATAALLINGADVNIVDSFGYVALTYARDSCDCKRLDQRHQHGDIIRTLYAHVKKLIHLKLDVSEANINIVKNERFKFNEASMKAFYKQVIKISTFVWEEESISYSMKDVFSETGIVAIFPYKAAVRISADKFWERIDEVLADYNEVIGIFRLQVRKGIKRLTLIHLAEESVKQLLGFDFPEICCHVILRFLHNTDLKNLAHATSIQR